MKITITFFGIMACFISDIYSLEVQKSLLTEQDVTIVLDELSKNKWEKPTWLSFAKRHAGELAEKINADEKIDNLQITCLKKELEKVHLKDEKGSLIERSSIRCNPQLLAHILDHAHSIREGRRVAFKTSEELENAE
ncbi:MAG: hypothetical protein M1114_06880 [Candidatus Dependentiae bacterium]|nr:hypothetical protein [Candidatus Dependentiae bacterium]